MKFWLQFYHFCSFLCFFASSARYLSADYHYEEVSVSVDENFEVNFEFFEHHSHHSRHGYRAAREDVLRKQNTENEEEKGSDDERTLCKGIIGRPKKFGDWNLLWIESDKDFKTNLVHYDVKKFSNIDTSRLVSFGKEMKREFYCAGYTEGLLTAREIDDFYANVYADWFTDFSNSPDSGPIFDFLQRNYDYMEKNVEYFTSEDYLSLNPSAEGFATAFEAYNYWSHVDLLLHQLKGLHAGYRAVKQKYELDNLPFEAFLFLSADGDIETLAEFMPKAEEQAMNKNHLRSSKVKRFDFASHREVRCSALIKAIGFGKHSNPDLDKDIFIGHTTWDHYENAAPRILKSFNLKGLDAFSFTMSSSPGMLSSVDDFYVTGNRFVVVETTNNVYNRTIYKHVKPESVLSWMRARIANTANTLAGWRRLFEHRNSGTYNNQWMVINADAFFGKIKQTGSLKDKHERNYFLVVEQLPGHFSSGYMDDVLSEEGYWASYNIPYFDEIADLANYSKQSPADEYDHETSPRAKIFRREIDKFHTGDMSLSSFKKLMRYNRFEEDPFSKGNACNAISSRCDLNHVTDPNYKASGGMDCKVLSLRSLLKGFQNVIFSAQLGPSHDDQPMFIWSALEERLFAEKYNVPSHEGHSNIFDFKWIWFGPRNISLITGERKPVFQLAET